MLNSPAFEKGLTEVDEAAGKRLEQLDADAGQWLQELDQRARAISDRTFVRGVWLIMIGCGGALLAAMIYRLFARKKA